MNSTLVAHNDVELMESCLEIITTRVDDLALLVYQRFFSLHPEAEELFGGSIGEDVQQYMIVELIMQLLDLANDNVCADIMRRWILDHTVYGVTLPMYSAMLNSLQESLAEVMAEDWNDLHQSTWERQNKKVMKHVEKFYAEQ